MALSIPSPHWLDLAGLVVVLFILMSPHSLHQRDEGSETRGPSGHQSGCRDGSWYQAPLVCSQGPKALDLICSKAKVLSLQSWLSGCNSSFSVAVMNYHGQEKQRRRGLTGLRLQKGNSVSQPGVRAADSLRQGQKVTDHSLHYKHKAKRSQEWSKALYPQSLPLSTHLHQEALLLLTSPKRHHQLGPRVPTPEPKGTLRFKLS